jgi:replication initiation and membrane attachment protein
LTKSIKQKFIIKDAFDFETFYEGLPIRLKKRRIFTKKVISQIASVMYVYNFTEREMIRILSSAYDEENNKIFAEKIGLLAREYFEKNYTESQITFEKQPEVADEVDLRTLKPQDIIAVIGGKMTNNSVALETIRKFIERNAVDIGLINGVIIASIKYTGHVPSLVYLEKVLADWLSKGIKTGKDALRVLQGIPETPKSKTRKRVSDDEPEWLDGIIASFDEEEE